MAPRRVLWAALLVGLAAGCDARKRSWPTPAETPAVEEARKLLTEAGYQFGSDFPKAELLYNTNEGHKKIAAAIQEMWRRKLGIEVELRNTEWKVYLERLTRLDYQIARRGWIGDYPDPNTFIDLFKSDSGNSNTGWANPEFDRLVREANRTPDPRGRLDLLQKAEGVLMDDLPVIPIYFYVSQSMWRPEAKGIHDNILNVHPLKEVVLGDGEKPFVLNAGAEPQTLDPNLQRGQPEHRINIALFEGLTSYHPKTLEPQPGVAESWSRSEDATTWTFKLRECRWTNGRAVTAGDFVYGWRRQIDPALGSDYSHIVFDFIKNAKAYYEGAAAEGTLRGLDSLERDRRREAAEDLVKRVQARHAGPLSTLREREKDPEIRGILEKAIAEAPKRKDVRVEDVGVRAPDDRTLVVELEAPTPFFLHLTCFFSYFPVPREAVEAHQDKWTRPENIVTNGPFRMKEWAANSHLLVERNPGYWDAAKVRQKQIRFLVQDNVNTAFNMFKAGQCDYIDTVPLEFVDALKGDPSFHSAPILTTYFYSFNVQRRPFDDRRVRRALALAIDRETLCAAILKGGQTPATSMVPPGLEGYRSPSFVRKAGPP
jgi:ABC-type oligopeptide transport system substrate-binding subunit